MYPSLPLWRVYSSCVVILHIIFSLHLLCSAQVLVQDGNVTCDVTSVEPLASTTLKCYFPEDVTQTKRNFSVYRYKEAIGQDEQTILDCSWWSGKRECRVGPGYNFTSILPYEVTLEIPRATVEHTGTYACLIGSPKLNNSKTCELKIKPVGKTMCDIPFVARESQTSLTCYFPEDISRTKTGFTVYHYTRLGDKNDVIDCDWKRDRIVCNPVHGYEFYDIEVADHVTLKIPSSSDDHEGTYSCQIKGDEFVRSESCSLKLLKETSSCDIPSVYEGEPTTLTCRFSSDVNVTKRNVQVVHVRGEGSKAVDILTCTWRHNELGCAVASEYEFNNTISDHLVIRIPRASRDLNGQYACHVLGSELKDFKPCPFIVVTGEDANFVPVIAITISIGVLLIIFGIPCCVFCCLRRKRFLSSKSVPLPEDVFSLSTLVVVPEEESSNLPQVSSIEKETSSSPPVLREEANTAQTQLFWLQWVEAAFPDLDSRAYFLPPVYFNRVPMTRESVVGQNVLVLQSAPGQACQSSRPAMTSSTAGQTCIPQPPRVQDSDVRDDAAMQRVMFCLQTLSEQTGEAFVGLGQLQFGQYLGEPCYTAAAAQLPLPANLPSALPKNWKQGDFDVLIIHRHYGFVICEIKAFGDNTQTLNMSQQDIDNNIRKKLKQAVSQLAKAEAMLSHLVSDIAPGLRITKTIAFPNLTARQVQQAISGDTRLTQDLCQCLGTGDPADIAGLCLCSDQLSDPKTPWDVSSHVLRELGHWWQRRVAGAGHDSHMTSAVYRTLVARFCGPATTVTVPCTCPPRVSVKTLGQAVWCTGECYTAVITLFPEQLHLLNTAPSKLFMAGPPGTGKTVVLQQMGKEWLRCGEDVYIVSTWRGSRAACIMLYHLLLSDINTRTVAGVTMNQLHLLQYDFTRSQDVEQAVDELSRAIRKGFLCVIVDEAYGDLQHFCDELLLRVPRLRLWAASCYHGNAPVGWEGAYLTRPLRSPPAVVREVEQDTIIRLNRAVKAYSSRCVPDHTDGPPVRRLYHRGQGNSGDCLFCGDEVAKFLRSLHIGENDSTFKTICGTPLPCLQWRDVLVLHGGRARDIAGMGIVSGMNKAGIPVQVMEDEDIKDVATACSDVVWATKGDRVLGLEKKIIVCVEFDDLYDRLHIMSRCMSQLVMISPLELYDLKDPRDDPKDTAEWQCQFPRDVDTGAEEAEDTNPDVDSGSLPELKVEETISEEAQIF